MHAKVVIEHFLILKEAKHPIIHLSINYLCINFYFGTWELLEPKKSDTLLCKRPLGHESFQTELKHILAGKKIFYVALNSSIQLT